MDNFSILLLLIAFAVIFDFINGFHDTANAIATVVATRVLSPSLAVLMAAVCNLFGALSGTAVAKTIGSGIIGTHVSQEVVMAALLGAILWNLITWYYGIPSSSSHALIGGLVGAGISSAGLDQVQWNVLVSKVGIPLLASPVIGFLVGMYLMKLIVVFVASRPPQKVNAFFRNSQLLSSAFMAFSHGSNDAQKTMGIITLALISAGYIPAVPFEVPFWVIMISATSMAAGTALGGWKIIHTMGNRLAQLTPMHGFTAETSAAVVIETASRLGFPLSTTHIISSTIMGVSASQRMKAVRWNVAQTIVQTWIFTIPVCVFLSWFIYQGIMLFK